MDGHYIHLLSNHFPVILSIAGFVVLTLGLTRHLKIVKQTGLAILFAASLSCIPAYLSGEEAEHKVEEYPGVSHSIIEEHEEKAELAFLVTDLVGILSFVSLLLLSRDHQLAVLANRFVWLASLASIILLFNVGKSGGEIRRPELRSEQLVDTISKDHSE